MQKTFLVNSDFIRRKVQADGRAIGKIIQDSGMNISVQTFKSMMDSENRFLFKTIWRASAILKTSVANLIKADECDRNKELDAYKLEKILNARGIKNKELAEMSHTDSSSVSAYLLGKKNPSVELVYCYACALDIEPEQILKNAKEDNLQSALFAEEPINAGINKNAIRIIDALIEMLSDLRDDLNEI